MPAKKSNASAAVFAQFVDLRIHQGSGTAELQFAKPAGGSFAVTIPLHDLVRLQNTSERKGAKAKLQAYRESRNADSS